MLFNFLNFLRSKKNQAKERRLGNPDIYEFDFFSYRYRGLGLNYNHTFVSKEINQSNVSGTSNRELLGDVLQKKLVGRPKRKSI